MSIPLIQPTAATHATNESTKSTKAVAARRPDNPTELNEDKLLKISPGPIVFGMTPTGNYDVSDDLSNARMRLDCAEGCQALSGRTIHQRSAGQGLPVSNSEPLQARMSRLGEPRRYAPPDGRGAPSYDD